MNVAQAQTDTRQKHQLYRVGNDEVVLDKEVEREKTTDGTLGSVLSWNVRKVKLERGVHVLGPVFQVKTSELQWIGRTIYA